LKLVTPTETRFKRSIKIGGLPCNGGPPSFDLNYRSLKDIYKGGNCGSLRFLFYYKFMNEKSTSDLFLEYHLKIEQFLKIDEMNMKDVQMALPSVRHYWVGRLIFHKQQIAKLKSTKEKARKTIREKIESESPITLNNKTITDSIQNHEIMLKIDEEIANHELLVEFLTKVEANLRDSQYGLNNLTKIITLETT